MVFQHCFHKQFLCKINMLKDVQEVKLRAMVLLGSISMILGMLPLKLGPKYFKTGTKSGWRNVVTSLLLCFGGGVLLATSLIHMLPEVKLRFILNFLKFWSFFRKYNLKIGKRKYRWGRKIRNWFQRSWNGSGNTILLWIFPNLFYWRISKFLFG